MSNIVYNVLKPKKEVKNPPMLVMLHGYGSDENDLFSFAELLNDKFLVISLRAPMRLPWGGYAWYNIDFTGSESRFGNPEEALNSMSKIDAFIGELIEKYQTDKDKTVLLGFSQGAILSYALATRNPDKYRTLLALSGYIFKEIMPKELSTSKASMLNIFASHGIQDEIIPIAWARNAEAWLKTTGVKNEYHEYNMGHGINPECFKDMLAWIGKSYPAL